MNLSGPKLNSNTRKPPACKISSHLVHWGLSYRYPLAQEPGLCSPLFKIVLLYFTQPKFLNKRLLQFHPWAQIFFINPVVGKCSKSPACIKNPRPQKVIVVCIWPILCLHNEFPLSRLPTNAHQQQWLNKHSNMNEVKLKIIFSISDSSGLKSFIPLPIYC